MEDNINNENGFNLDEYLKKVQDKEASDKAYQQYLSDKFQDELADHSTNI